MTKQKLVVLTGAGMSAESGIKTFRDSNGLWENHDIADVASPEGFAKNPELVYEFYNLRRAQLKSVSPNRGHEILAALEAHLDVQIVTQNVDNLHERAGSSKVLHLHGELTKVRSLERPELIYDWTEDLTINDRNELGHQLRPHIVWFGEQVPMMENAIDIMKEADMVVIIGTSMQVYPAASLVYYAGSNVPICYIDPKPAISRELSKKRPGMDVIELGASEGLELLSNTLLKHRQ